MHAIGTNPVIYVLSWNVEREHAECMLCAWYFLISKQPVSRPAAGSFRRHIHMVRFLVAPQSSSRIQVAREVAEAERGDGPVTGERGPGATTNL